jgi:aspartyl protease family protein
LAGWLALILLVLAAIAIVLRSDAGDILGYSAAELAAAAFALAVIIVVAVPLARRYQGRFSLIARDLTVWTAIAAGLAALYIYRDELPGFTNDLISQVAPQETTLTVPEPVESERLVRLRRQPSGHFVARALLNGEAVQMVVDTGATTIVLRSADAELIGINIAALTFTVPVQTANGSALAAPVKLQSVLVGPVGAGNVDALVAKPGTLDQSLLGMSFLSRLKSYEFSGDFLTLRG